MPEPKSTSRQRTPRTRRPQAPEGYELFTADEAKGLREKAAKAPDKDHVILSQREVRDLRVAARRTEAFAQRLARTEEQLFDAKFTEVFAQARREGRVDAKDETREKWFARFKKYGVDEATELLHDLPAETIPVNSRGIDVAPPEPEAQEEVPEGTDAEAFSFHRKAEKLSQEEGITYEESVQKLVASGERF